MNITEEKISVIEIENLDELTMIFSIVADFDDDNDQEIDMASLDGSMVGREYFQEYFKLQPENVPGFNDLAEPVKKAYHDMKELLSQPGIQDTLLIDFSDELFELVSGDINISDDETAEAEGHEDCCHPGCDCK